MFESLFKAEFDSPNAREFKSAFSRALGQITQQDFDRGAVTYIGGRLPDIRSGKGLDELRKECESLLVDHLGLQFRFAADPSGRIIAAPSRFEGRPLVVGSVQFEVSAAFTKEKNADSRPRFVGTQVSAVDSFGTKASFSLDKGVYETLRKLACSSELDKLDRQREVIEAAQREIADNTRRLQNAAVDLPWKLATLDLPSAASPVVKLAPGASPDAKVLLISSDYSVKLVREPWYRPQSPHTKPSDNFAYYFESNSVRAKFRRGASGRLNMPDVSLELALANSRLTCDGEVVSRAFEGYLSRLEKLRAEIEHQGSRATVKRLREAGDPLLERSLGHLRVELKRRGARDMLKTLCKSELDDPVGGECHLEYLQVEVERKGARDAAKTLRGRLEPWVEELLVELERQVARSGSNKLLNAGDPRLMRLPGEDIRHPYADSTLKPATS